MQLELSPHTFNISTHSFISEKGYRKKKAYSSRKMCSDVPRCFQCFIKTTLPVQVLLALTDPSLKSSVNNPCTGKVIFTRHIKLFGTFDTVFCLSKFFFKCYPFSDINECVEIPNVCGSNSNCANYNGGYNCTCLSGFQVTNASQSISVSNQCTGK